MVKTLNYILDGFGFLNLEDFKKSTFGFMLNEKILVGSSVIGGISAITDAIQNVFGVNHAFFTAYAVLILFEWLTGVLAAGKRGEQHSSRKLGRMLLKLAVYSIPIYVFNTFNKNLKFPSVVGFEIDPFAWLYYIVLVVIIWQLFVSLLENLSVLKFKYAKVLLKIINKKFYSELGLEDTEDD